MALKFLTKEKDVKFVKYLEVLLTKGYFKGVQDEPEMKRRLDKAKLKFYKTHPKPKGKVNEKRTTTPPKVNFLQEYKELWKNVGIASMGGMVAGHAVGMLWKRSKL